MKGTTNICALRRLPFVTAAALLLAGPVLAQVVDQGPRTPRRLKGMAEQYEKDGLKAEAAQAYEALLELEPATRAVVAPRLVQLYIDSRQPQRALDWARKVKDGTPDPPAYLAGVYARLGGYNEARALLEKELAVASEPHRRLALHWQLADVYLREGKQAEAEKELQAALETVTGTEHEAQATARLERFRAADRSHGAGIRSPR